AGGGRRGRSGPGRRRLVGGRLAVTRRGQRRGRGGVAVRGLDRRGLRGGLAGGRRDRQVSGGVVDVLGRLGAGWGGGGDGRDGIGGVRDHRRGVGVGRRGRHRGDDQPAEQLGQRGRIDGGGLVPDRGLAGLELGVDFGLTF